jgi:REP element-mobilizing transposase RayT
MTDKFQNKYRISSARLQNWDYRWVGAYFITICTQNREPYFGKIENGEMRLSPSGAIADVLWHEIKNHSKNIEWDAFVVMPNYLHSILILNGDDIENSNGTCAMENAGNVESTPQSTTNEFMASISPKSNSVSTIIRSYKSAVTKYAHRLGFAFEWQSRFHDHIIRDNKSFETIQTYIIENPLNWVDEKFYN